MTGIPVPILFAMVVLIGWPLAQLVSEWLVAGARSEVRALVDELRRDSRFGEADRKLLDRRLADAKGSPGLVLAPVFVPFGVFVISSAVLLGKSPPEATKEEFEALRLRLEAAEEFGGPSLKIREDDRYRRLVALTDDIRILRWPVGLLLTGAIALMTLPIYLLAYGLHSSWTAFVTRIVRRYAVSIRFAQQGL